MMSDRATVLVSIGMPTYNRASGYLKQALQSAVSQTYQNIEIVVSDNCSSDDTESVVKSFNDPRIRYYKQKDNIGPLNNRNFCLQQSQGEYFLLLFDDDVIDVDFISTCMNARTSGSKPGIILTGAREIDSKGNVLSAAQNNVSGSSTGDFILGWFERQVPLYLCNTLFNTIGLKQLGGFHSKTNRYDDVVASVQLAAKYGRIDISDIKASFRRHGSNIGKNIMYHEWCDDSLYLMDIMCAMAPEHAGQIRKRGMSYFCFRCYRHAGEIKSSRERFWAYLNVYRTFDYSYSPLKFQYVKNMSRIKNFVKRRIARL